MDKDKERLMGLLDLQNKLIDKFGENDYNVFIFGSYITHAYIAGKSDIDVAVYAEDFKKYLQISVFIEEYFNNLGVEQDIFFVNTLMPAPIFCAALESPITLTDYYPQKLSDFYARCKNQQATIK